MPIGVDRETVNYIRNILLTNDDKSSKQWIKDLAEDNTILNEQRTQIFD